MLVSKHSAHRQRVGEALQARRVGGGQLLHGDARPGGHHRRNVRRRDLGYRLQQLLTADGAQ